MSRRRSWIAPVVLAVVLFLGELAANWLPITVPLALRPWLWGAIGAALLAAILLAVWEYRQANQAPDSGGVTFEQSGQEIEGNQQNIGGDVHGLAVVGDAVDASRSTGAVFKPQGPVTQHFYTVYRQPPGEAHLSEEQFQRVLSDYLDWASKAYAQARLYGLESVRTAKGRPVRNLAEIFVPLSLGRFRPPSRWEVERAARKLGDDSLAQHRAYLILADKRKQAGESVALADLLTVHHRLAVIGGAGSGKSTLLAYLAFSLAEHARLGAALPFRLPEGKQAPIPLLVPLRYYRQYQEECRGAQGRSLDHPRTGTLAGFIPWYLKRRSPALELSEDFFDRLLLGGGCLLMLDGLDEVVDQKERGRVRQQVEQIANDIYPRNRIIVTAREAGYRENAVFGDDFLRLDVQPLDPEQTQVLVRNWCQQLYPTEVEPQTQAIVEAIQRINERYRAQNLPPLIDTPLMTTMVISVKWGETELPRERAQLYEAAVKVILQAQYLAEDESRETLVNWGGPWEIQREWLAHLALAMHSRGQAGAALPEEEVRAILRERMTSAQLDAFLAAVRLRGGLLEERAELFQFIHLTFQEFLAARLLAKQRKEAWPELVKHVRDSWWREVFLLHYGFAKVDYEPYAQQFLDWLSDLPELDDEIRLAGVELAGAAVLEIERPDPAIRRAQAERLAVAITDPTWKTRATQRIQAGNLLARLGDPRLGVGLDANGLPEMDWGPPIQAGEFPMGSDKRKDSLAWDDETPQFTCQLIREPYRISRYPVTVAQYRAFVGAGGYRKRRYWTDAGWAWREREGITGPEEYDEPFGLANHPVVGVSWYEAVAYCRWLRDVLGYEVRLPTEAEWERAARGTDGRIWPWEDEAPTDEHCNFGRKVGATTPVGVYPKGASPYGVLDMAGNVWEWCSTKWLDNYGGYEEKVDDDLEGDAPRVVRGGSWGYSHRNVRCAFRHGNFPYSRDYYYGFRVVAPGL